MRENMSATEALSIWGKYECGGRLRSVGIKESEGGISGYDYAYVVSQHVEKFWHYRYPLGDTRALFLFVEQGGNVSEYRWRGPGENKTYALTRAHWLRFNNAMDVPAAVYRFVLEQFESWLADYPVPHEIDDLPDAETDQQFISDVRRRRIGVKQTCEALGREVTPNQIEAVRKLFQRGCIAAWRLRHEWETTIGDVQDYLDARRVRSSRRVRKA